MRTTNCLVALLLVSVVSIPGIAQTWTELTPAGGSSPTGRNNVSSIYDPVEHRIVIYGGRTAGGFVDDTWAFDLDTNQWTELTPSGPTPSARHTANAIYDHANRKMIIWSGQGGQGFHNDVWAFDLDNPGWSEYSTSAPLPNVRYGTAAVFDPVGRELVTFAGFTNQGRFDDTWRFDIDGSAWTDVTPAGTSPVERCLHSATYDHIGHQMIMYGGQRTGALDDIWAFDLNANTWTELTPAVRPVGRFFTAQTHDVIRRHVTIFGGTRTQGGLTDEVWSFDVATASWNQLTPTGQGPNPREGSAAVHLPGEDRIIIIGGRGNGFWDDVWELNLSGGNPVVFPWEIVADGDLFRWPVPTNVQFASGDLAQVGSYAFDAIGRGVHATSFRDPVAPPSGEGTWYLVKFDSDAASWQSGADAEPTRDSLLP